MRRAWLLSFLGFALVMPAAADCEYRPEWRGRTIDTYVRDADICLSTLKEGFWIDEQIEAEVFARVNTLRADAGLPELVFRPGLVRPARLHSFDMAQDQFFDHRAPDGRRASDRVAALDRTLIHSEVRENIAAVSGDVEWNQVGELLHNLLVNSQGHLANMLAPDLTHMAMGVVRSEEGAWLTQVFVREEGTFDAPVPIALSADVGPAALPVATLSSWVFRETLYVIAEPDADAETAPAPGHRGDIAIRVVGTRPIDDRSYRIIQLIGPAATLVD